MAGLPAFCEPALSGKFVLHKFARTIGSETYSIEPQGDHYALSSHFLFTDRGSAVPLDTSFSARSADMAPSSYKAKGKASRWSAMDDEITATETGQLTIKRNGRTETRQTDGPWFIADGYSPVAMQEQMMRWWLSHGRLEEFTVYPADSKVHIRPAGTVLVNGTMLTGYTVGGLIWGQESLWMDSAQNLAALVSNDAEFDHFEALREPYTNQLATFIAAAARADLAVLQKLSARALVSRPRVLAITGATLEDSLTNVPVRDSVILIEDGLIKAAGPRGQVTIPAGAEILDASGKFAIPGLWDMHAHYEQVEWGPIYLASGVTTVRDVGNEFDFVWTLHRELNRSGASAGGPHFEFAGVIDGNGPITLGAVVADTPSEAQKLVREYKAAGARQIKIYSSVKPEVVKAICTEAHALNLTVTGHVPEGMTAIEAIHAGMDQINHLQYLVPYFSREVSGAEGKPDRSKPPVLDPDGPRAKDLISTLKAHGTVVDPTFALSELILHTVPLRDLEPGVDHLAPQLHEALDIPPATGEGAVRAEGVMKLAQVLVHALHAAGVPVIAGTDQAIPGYSLHRELELYVQSGFTPAEALQTATIEAARAVGAQNESGSLTPGKRGDVVLLNADPLASIRNSRAIWRTVASGAVYDPAPLWQSVGFLP
jgi:imidazolonepropionase-like amidohydrolase